MIERYHEAPNSIFKRVQRETDGDYCLAHLYNENKEYRDNFKEAVAKGRKVILDNSIFEGKGLSNAEYASLIEDLRPSHYIIPDVLEDRSATVSNFKTFLEEFPDLSGIKIGVMQGKNYKDLIACYNSLIHYGADMVAISFDYSYYQIMFPNIEDKLFAWCQGRSRLIDKMIGDGIIDYNKDHHLLGCSLAKEFSYYHDVRYSFITSVDTSNPVVAGMFNLKYEIRRGLETKPSMKLCDMIDNKLSQEQEELVMYNIEEFKRIAGNEN